MASDEVNPSEMKLKELKEECRKQSLSTEGTQEELVERLQVHLKDKKAGGESSEANKTSVLDMLNDRDEHDDIEEEILEKEDSKETGKDRNETASREEKRSYKEEKRERTRDSRRDRQRYKRSVREVFSLRGMRSDKRTRERRDVEPRSIKSIKRVRVKRILIRNVKPRKGPFDDLTFTELEEEHEKYPELAGMDNITIEIDNEGAKAPVRPGVGETTNSLRVDGFVRPFRVSQVKELLDKYGQVTHMWMNKIKTHCYVMYSSKKEAKECQEALDGLRWPDESRKTLQAIFVSEDEAIEAARPKVEPKTVDKKPETKSRLKTLDELFRRTKALPSIYWKPAVE